MSDSVSMVVHFDNHKLEPVTMTVDEADVEAVVEAIIEFSDSKMLHVQSRTRDYVFVLDKVAYIELT